MNPPDAVAAALPGTLAELATATGYPVGQVLKFLTHARRNGVRVNATMQSRDPDGAAVTMYAVANEGDSTPLDSHATMATTPPED